MKEKDKGEKEEMTEEVKQYLEKIKQRFTELMFNSEELDTLVPYEEKITLVSNMVKQALQEVIPDDKCYFKKIRMAGKIMLDE